MGDDETAYWKGIATCIIDNQPGANQLGYGGDNFIVVVLYWWVYSGGKYTTTKNHKHKRLNGEGNMIEVGQILLRKNDNGIQSKVVGHCKFEGIQHYYLKELSRIREGSDVPERNSGNFQQNIVLSDYGIKMAYELPNESKYRQLKLRNYDNLVSMVAGLFQKNKKV